MPDNSELIPASDAPLVSIVVVTYNAPEYVRLCVEGILKRTRVPIELIIVDNASEPETRRYLETLPGIRLILNDENRLWCAGCNQGMRASDPRSRYLLLLNSDVEVKRDDWLEVMLAPMQRDPRVAIVGTKHRRIPLGPVHGFIDGHCLLFRRQLLDELGYFDEVRWPWWGAPAELAIAAFARGRIYKVVHPNDRIILHHGERSKTTELRDTFQLLAKPRGQFEEIMARYGLKPKRPLVERSRFLRRLRPLAERFRFYHAPRLSAPSATVRAKS